MFNDELDLLELRLRHLNGVVDRFVLVEADRTFSGLTKPLAFAENKERFRAWLGKIDHVQVSLTGPARVPFDRENEHRRALRDHLRATIHERVDLVVLGDVDEFPAPYALRYLRDSIDVPMRLLLRHAIYFANWVLEAPWSNSTLALRPQHLSTQMARAQLGEPHDDWRDYREHQLPDAGLHLSFLGGAESIRSKWAAYGHQTEFDNWRFNGRPHLERLVAFGVHFEGRNVLRRLCPGELDDQLLQLADLPIAQPFFNFDRPPISPMSTRAYCAYTWLRAQGHLSERACRVADTRQWLTTRALKPALAGLDWALARRRARRAPPDWRRPILHEWPSWSPDRTSGRRDEHTRR